MNSSNEQTRKAVRRSYHKRRVLELREERNRINKFLLEHRASSLHGAEISKLEKRLFRIEHLIQSSEYAYHTGGFGTAHELPLDSTPPAPPIPLIEGEDTRSDAEFQKSFEANLLKDGYFDKNGIWKPKGVK